MIHRSLLVKTFYHSTTVDSEGKQKLGRYIFIFIHH